MEEYTTLNERNDKQLSHDSESEYCSSSCCSDSDGEKQPWLENVKSDGSLFYIEYDADLDPFLEDSVNHSYPGESWSHITQSKLKLNAAERIKRWMKGRKKKVRKSFPLKSSRNEVNSFSSVDAFSHFHSKDIYVDVDSSKMIPSYKLSLSEKLFGLKLETLEDNCGINDTPTILRVISSEEIRDIKIGDLLKSVNDIDINMSNVEDILKSIPVPSKVKLSFMSPPCQFNTKSHLILPKHNNLIKELLGDSSAVQYARLQYQHIPHGLFYLCIENGTFENDDVVYRYPNENTSLFQLKGMFLTLGHMISDVASSPLLSCSVMIQGEIVHIGYVKEENDIMILALPASVASIAEVQHFSSDCPIFYQYETKYYLVGNKREINTMNLYQWQGGDKNYDLL